VITTQYLAWCCTKLEAAGEDALLLARDNAPWHVSRTVRAWIRPHNRCVKQTGPGVRIVPCYLPFKSPWLNPIEPNGSKAGAGWSDPTGSCRPTN
jgi:transposase